MGLGLGVIFDDIQRYNQRKYNEWKRKKKREQHYKNPSKYSEKNISKSVLPQTSQSNFRANFASAIPRFPTLKDGELVRSLSEKYVADFFYTHKVAYEYEKHLFLDGYKIKPDFYLPAYDLYVEFWGMLDNPGYLDKVNWKFAMYQKHGINFIALNPDDQPVSEESVSHQIAVCDPK